jgi:hypothetical protein
MRIKTDALHTRCYALSLLILIQSCALSPVSPSRESARWIVIPVFANDTFESGLGGKVTRMVKQEFLSQRGFQITQDPSQAELLLEGRITSFGQAPLSFDKNFQVAEYRVSIIAEVRILKTKDQKLVWQQKGVRADAEYGVNPDPGLSRSAQDLAINEAANRLAERFGSRFPSWNKVTFWLD